MKRQDRVFLIDFGCYGVVTEVTTAGAYVLGMDGETKFHEWFANKKLLVC